MFVSLKTIGLDFCFNHIYFMGVIFTHFLKNIHYFHLSYFHCIESIVTKNDICAVLTLKRNNGTNQVKTQSKHHTNLCLIQRHKFVLCSIEYLCCAHNFMKYLLKHETIETPQKRHKLVSRTIN